MTDEEKAYQERANEKAIERWKKYLRDPDCHVEPGSAEWQALTKAKNKELEEFIRDNPHAGLF